MLRLLILDIKILINNENCPLFEPISIKVLIPLIFLRFLCVHKRVIPVEKMKKFLDQN